MGAAPRPQSSQRVPIPSFARPPPPPHPRPGSVDPTGPPVGPGPHPDVICAGVGSVVVRVGMHRPGLRSLRDPPEPQGSEVPQVILSHRAVCAPQAPGRLGVGPSPHSASPSPRPAPQVVWRKLGDAASSKPHPAASLWEPVQRAFVGRSLRTWTWPWCQATGSSLRIELYIGRCLSRPLPPLRHQHSRETVPTAERPGQLPSCSGAQRWAPLVKELRSAEMPSPSRGAPWLPPAWDSGCQLPDRPMGLCAS